MMVKLTEKEGCYAKYLKEGKHKILEWYKDESISVKEFKTLVHNLVKIKSKKTDAYNRFLKILFSLSTKVKIVNYIDNIIKKADNEGRPVYFAYY